MAPEVVAPEITTPGTLTVGAGRALGPGVYVAFPATMVIGNVEFSAPSIIVSGNVPLVVMLNPCAAQSALKYELTVALVFGLTTMFPSLGYSLSMRSKIEMIQSLHKAFGGMDSIA